MRRQKSYHVGKKGGDAFNWLDDIDFDVGRVQLLELIPRYHALVPGLERLQRDSPPLVVLSRGIN